ncbi:CDP-glucose 4,6-dehydratase [Helicobacter sp. 11S02629-2]|uniref:CDP-glucose 4,6-dehydratase n=1 Tax=Helicobacter sp. 11S02629-2 TaxID=1476195 RepID=UPI000BA53E45|nr:CDP-glucose 4,6-dehydratase [Helicobacter sp. 11S02629-2]PAF44658.1 CDP-glucose 4,6-dehydratase [Helicobacter sp. 11S02629-2]
MLSDIYKGKKVFITGHTGFKGSWLALWLTHMGAKVCGYSLAPETNPSMFEILNIKMRIDRSIIADILDIKTFLDCMQDFQPEVVFHLAAQPLVRLSYLEPILTYETNVIGTLNVLMSASKVKSVRSFVNITTDKCYENKEMAIGYKEDDAMGGHDMYSSSKGCVELMSASFRRSFLQGDDTYAMATARAGNVIGGGDWASDRLIPDCIKAINKNCKIEIRNPAAIRPWQHVLEPLSGYLLLGAKLLSEGKKYAQGFNFGPDESSVLKVLDVAKEVVRCYGKGELVVYKKDSLHEANLLMLDIQKARDVLGWIPTYDALKAIDKTIRWYRHFYERTADLYEFTIQQIKDYEKDISWKKN